MIVVIPTSTRESWYQETVTLDGVDFVLTCAWCERERRWYLDIATADGTVLRSGIKIVADRPLTQRMTDDLRPLGELWCLDWTGLDGDPDLRDLGARCALLYVEEDSVV